MEVAGLDTDRVDAAGDPFRLVLERAAEGLLVIDRRALVTYASPFVASYVGRSRDELIGSPIDGLLGPDDGNAIRALISSDASPGDAISFATSATDGDDTRWFEGTATNLLRDPRIDGVVLSFRDVTQQHRADAQREAIAALGLHALDGNDPTNLMARACTAVAAALEADAVLLLEGATDHRHLTLVAAHGWPNDEIGRTILAQQDSLVARSRHHGGASIVDDFEDPPVLPLKRFFRDRGFRSSVGVPILVAGTTWGVLRALSRRRARFETRDADFLQAVANIVASSLERTDAMRQLECQALHDSLTGLPNRVLLHDRIEQALLAQGREPDVSVCVAFVDLDHFKRVNDTYGHDGGDDLLRVVARRLQASVRPSDTVSRIGGDEFVVVAQGQDSEELATRLLRSIGEPVELPGGAFYPSASVGLAIGTKQQHDAASLLRDADLAMYEAKLAGRNSYVTYQPAMRERLSHRLNIEQELQSALAGDELLLYYQPIIDIASSEPTGFEALLRWNHPDLGIVGPDTFMRAAEESRLIIPIGEWVIRTACRQLARWQHELNRPDLNMSVNLSPHQLADTQLIGHVRRALTTTAIAPETLTLEITETSIIADLATAAHVLDALSTLGCGIALDDFGTGYSSLNYLRGLPLTSIKIDRSFITDIQSDPTVRAIDTAILQLADALGIVVVAEGVETHAQHQTLKALGCKRAQGFHYAVPQPADHVTDWLMSHCTRSAR